MTPEQLNNLMCLETENKLLVKHNKDLMKENEELKLKYDKLNEKFLLSKAKTRRLNERHNISNLHNNPNNQFS